MTRYCWHGVICHRHVLAVSVPFGSLGQFQFWELTKNMSDFGGVGLPFEILHRTRGHNNAEKVMLIQLHSSSRRRDLFHSLSLQQLRKIGLIFQKKKMLSKQAHLPRPNITYVFVINATYFYGERLSGG